MGGLRKIIGRFEKDYWEVRATFFQVVTSPVLVTSSHKTESEVMDEEEGEGENKEEEEEDERDSGTESVAEVKETVLWEEKVTFPSIPSNNQQMLSE